jgi:hypothetical protein
MYAAYWFIYHYIDVLEDFIHDNDTFMMLLERYNDLIHGDRFMKNIPITVWNTIERQLFVAQLSALCGMNDPASFLEMFAEVKGVVRKYFVSQELISRRMMRSGDIGSMGVLPNDCIWKISSLLFLPVDP